MWSQSNGDPRGMSHPPAPPLAGDASWEEMYDSGQLDQQFRSMNFNVPPPPSYPPNFSQPPPTMTILPRPRGGHPNPRQYRPPQPQFRVPPPTIQPQHQQNVGASSAHNPFQLTPVTPVPHVQLQTSSDHGKFTPYQPPEPKMTILKRPQSSPSDLAAQGIGSGSNSDVCKVKKTLVKKTLRQREEDYAKARLRILGSAGSPEPEEDSVNSNNQAVSAQKPKQNDVSTIREPRGPDGTAGFKPRK